MIFCYSCNIRGLYYHTILVPNQPWLLLWDRNDDGRKTLPLCCWRWSWQEKLDVCPRQGNNLFFSIFFFFFFRGRGGAHPVPPPPLETWVVNFKLDMHYKNCATSFKSDFLLYFFLAKLLLNRHPKKIMTFPPFQFF